MMFLTIATAWSAACCAAAICSADGLGESAAEQESAGVYQEHAVQTNREESEVLVRLHRDQGLEGGWRVAGGHRTAAE